MDHHAHIASLVEKLSNDRLSPEELRELQHLFRSAEARGEVEGWLADVWESSGKQGAHSIDSTLLYRQIHQKIRHSERIHPVFKDRNDRIHGFVRSLMRYAAVFVLAIVCSWYWFGKSEQPESQKSDVSHFAGNNEVSVTYGSKTRIVLPDSSVVFLNSGSRLSYPSVFDRERHVTLIGEGYFIVRSDSLHPFLVHTDDVSIKALGTEFNVKAYPEEGSVETVLVSGSVEILKRGQTNPIIELKPGEKASYVKPAAPKQPTADASTNVAGVAKAQPQLIVNVDSKPDVSIGWVKNHLVFDAEPFEQIAARIERWFHVEIDIRNAALRKARLSGRYDTENIEQVMQSLQMTTPFTYTIEKNQIIIK
jgi:ferric-dicitrate binding protein FerR (iron transport regulator)